MATQKVARRSAPAASRRVRRSAPTRRRSTRRWPPAAAARAAAEARRAALPEQLQGRMASQGLAPPTHPRRTPKPIDRLVEHNAGSRAADV